MSTFHTNSILGQPKIPKATLSMAVCTLGRAEKWKNAILEYADVDYYGIIYIKTRIT